MEQSIGQFNWAPGAETALLGELHPLLEQLGSLDGLSALNAASESLLCPQINCGGSLEFFLVAYRTQVLLPFEWPAIFAAHWLTRHNQSRELIALDREIAGQHLRHDFARASRRVGQSHLHRLRPLRDLRIVQRYIEAVDRREADGWHTLIYGMTLAIYSLPVRQGLLGYARQTLRGFIHAASGPLQLSHEQSEDILATQCADLPRHLEKIVLSSSPK